jgi:3-deoxy-D-manno-octulosonic acid (KDO) 8-phosphate synthase
MKETVKKRVEALEEAMGHPIVLIVVDSTKEPGEATVDGKKMSIAEMEELLKTLPKTAKIFKIEVEPNLPWKGKVEE